MSRRGENIHERKDGRWEGRYKKGHDCTGTILYSSVYGKTYDEVKYKLDLAEQCSNLLCTYDNKIRFEEVLRLWLKNSQIHQKGATVNKYIYLIDNHIIPELGNIKITDLNSTIINSFIMRKMQGGRLDGKGGLSASYVCSMTLIINSALQFAIREHICPYFEYTIFKPQNNKKEIRILTRDEQKKLENYLLLNLDPTRAGIMLSLHTGLRIGELCALSWRDIDMDMMVIHIKHTVARVAKNDLQGKNSRLIIDTPKTKASIRDIPISSVLFPTLQKIYKNEQHGNYFLSGGDNFVNPRTYEYRFHRLLNNCGINSINFHALRHTFATRCIEAGVDIKSLSEILGHANVSITLNTYVHSSIEMKRKQLEKLSVMMA